MAPVEHLRFAGLADKGGMQPMALSKNANRREVPSPNGGFQVEGLISEISCPAVTCQTRS